MPSFPEYLQQLESVGRAHADAPLAYRSYYMTRFVPRAGDRILDLGAYGGANMIHYALLGHHAEGVEGATSLRPLYEDSVAQAGVGESCRMHWCLIEAFTPELPFDSVICGEVLSLVLDPVAICRKAYDCLRPGGQFFVTMTQKRFPPHVREGSLEHMTSWMEEAGFDVKQAYHWKCEVPQLICTGRT